LINATLFFICVGAVVITSSWKYLASQTAKAPPEVTPTLPGDPQGHVAVGLPLPELEEALIDPQAFWMPGSAAFEDAAPVAGSVTDEIQRAFLAPLAAPNGDDTTSETKLAFASSFTGYLLARQPGRPSPNGHYYSFRDSWELGEDASTNIATDIGNSL
jgi:hypothetical protein